MAKKTVNIDLIVDSKGTVKTISTVKKQFDSLGNSVKPLNNGLNNTTKGLGNTTNAVINFNRVIQDSPYGIIGVANNIDPLVQSFISLKKETGSATNAFKTLLKSAFTGPAALITVFSLASTAAVFFAMKMRGAGSASKEAEESIKDQIKAVNDLNKAYNQLAGFSLGQEIQQEIDLIDEAINLANKRADAQKELNAINRSRVNLAEDYKSEVEAAGSLFKAKQNIKDALKEEIANYDVLIQRLGFEETKLDDLTEKREDAVKKLEAYNNAQSESAQLAKLVQETQAEVNQTIDSYTAKVEGSDTAVVALAASLTGQINKYRELANEGNTEVIPVIVALQKEYDKLQKATEFDVTQILPDASFFDELRPKVEALKDEFLELSQIDLDNLLDLGTQNIEGSIADLQEQIRKLKQLQLQAFSTEGVEYFQEKINALQDQIDVLTGKIKESELEQFFRNLGYAAIDVSSFIVQSGIDIEESLDRQIEKIRERTAEERTYLEAEIEGIRKRADEEANLAKSRKEKQKIREKAEKDVQTVIEQSKNLEIQAAKDVAEAKRQADQERQDQVRDAIKSIIIQIALEQLKNVISTVPFPINIPVGAAAAAAITALANGIVGSLPGFADGVTGFGGGLALVGERGRELVQLPQGSNVITNQNTESIISAMARQSNTESIAQIGSTQPDIVSAIKEAFEDVVLPKIQGEIDNDVIRLSLKESTERLNRNTIQIGI